MGAQLTDDLPQSHKWVKLLAVTGGPMESKSPFLLLVFWSIFGAVSIFLARLVIKKASSQDGEKNNGYRNVLVTGVNLLMIAAIILWVILIIVFIILN